jgi:hypothetical protein
MIRDAVPVGFFRLVVAVGFPPIVNAQIVAELVFELRQCIEQLGVAGTSSQPAGASSDRPTSSRSAVSAMCRRARRSTEQSGRTSRFPPSISRSRAIAPVGLGSGVTLRMGLLRSRIARGPSAKRIRQRHTPKSSLI